MRPRLRVPDEVRTVIDGLHPGIKRKVRAAFDAIVADPTAGDVLRDRLTGFRRFRVGRWRIVYRERPGEIQIRVVGPRATVYSDLIAELERLGRARGRDRRAADERAERLGFLERLRRPFRGVPPEEIEREALGAVTRVRGRKRRGRIHRR